jgi:hypothetical protein
MWPFRKKKDRVAAEDAIQAIGYLIAVARDHERECTRVTHDVLRFYARICFEVMLGRSPTDEEEHAIVGTFYALPRSDPSEIPF